MIASGQSLLTLISNAEETRNFNYVQLFKSMQADSSQTWSQLYQFNVMLIAMYTRFEKHIMQMNTLSSRRWFFQFVHFFYVELQLIMISTPDESILMWKIKSRICHNEEFLLILRFYVVFAPFCFILNLSRARWNRSESRHQKRSSKCQ